jgi:GlpG protein
MRQLATLPSATLAQSLADYLLTLKIQTRLIQEPEGWAVWVCDEDRMPQAREEFAQFQQNPQDARFRVAAREADDLRREERRTEEEYQRRDSRFRRRMYNQQHWVVTLSLIVASVVVFLLFSMRGEVANRVAQSLLISSYVQVDEHQNPRADLSEIASGQVWRLITPIFLHFGIWHLLFNMLLLYRLGIAIEARRGSWRLLGLVLVLAVESNVLQYYFGHLSWVGAEVVAHPSPLFGGMSGVIYGLFGYVLIKVSMEPDRGFQMAPSTVIWLLLWFFLCFIPDFQEIIGRVANMAHAAGLMGGVLLGLAGTAWRRIRGA